MMISATELAGLLALVAVLGGLIFVLQYVRKTASEPHEDTVQATTSTAGATAPRGGGRRRRGGLERLRQAVEAENGAGSSEGRVKKKKEANREAKREAREAHLARLEEMRERERMEEEERREREEREEEERKEREEVERKEREEREKKEQEEYEEWKGMMAVEEAGEEEVEEEDPEMLEKFCGYVKEKRVVVLEDLGGEFGMRTEEVIDRLQRLEEVGRVSGVFDDRGKFIYVGEGEMKDVAEFIRKRGRVSISELASESSRLLKLDQVQVA